MGICKDIYVNIHNYDSESTYLVFLVPIGSVVMEPVITSLSRVALSSVVLFQNLTSTDYTVCVRKTCANGAVSTVCKPLVDNSCSAPEDMAIANITDTTADITFTPAAGKTYEVSINGGPYEDKGASSPIALVDLITGSLYTVDMRTSCGSGAYSFPVRKEFTTTAASAVFVKDDLKVVCNGSIYLYHRIRFTLSGGVAAVGSVYAISATGGGVIATYTVQPGDTMLDVVNGLTATLVVGTKTINVTNAYFTVDLKDPNAPGTCSDVDIVSSIDALLTV